MKAPHIRFRIDFNAQCAIGPGKIELLEGIARTGSLSQAAREMEMSYRRAWLLLDSINTAFDEPLVNAKTGGVDGGGAQLTEFGAELIRSFRSLEKSIGALAARELVGVAKHVPAGAPARAKAAAGKRRKLVRRKTV
jgi:molybdate transport system regulatory protein